jgi:hypothetical protein
VDEGPCESEPVCDGLDVRDIVCDRVGVMLCVSDGDPDCDSDWLCVCDGDSVGVCDDEGTCDCVLLGVSDID